MEKHEIIEFNTIQTSRHPAGWGVRKDVSPVDKEELL
jgi:hypothetical protein